MAPLPAMHRALAAPAALILLAVAVPGLRATGPDLRDAIRQGIKYDPAIRAARLKERAAEAASPASSAAPAAPASATPTPQSHPDDGVLVLPSLVVEAPRGPGSPAMPQLHVADPVKDLPGEPFESPSGRSARLIRKHFTPFEKFLGRLRLPLFGTSLAARAAQREAAESASLQLNEIAELLELSLLAGTDSPEERERLRAEFWKAYYNRSR